MSNQDSPSADERIKYTEIRALIARKAAEIRVAVATLAELAIETPWQERDELRAELVQAKERVDLLNRGQREMVLALAQLRGQLSARDEIDAERRESELRAPAQPSIESQAQADPETVPAMHRPGSEPLSRVIGDIDYCLTKINSEHEVFAILVRVGVALRMRNPRPTASPQSEPAQSREAP